MNRSFRWFLLLAAVVGAAFGAGVRVSFDWFHQASAVPGSKGDDGDPERLRSLLQGSGDFSAPIQAVAELVNPSVVNISSRSVAGSGFIYDQQGYIVTNNHVIRESERTLGRRVEYTVELWNGEKLEAKPVGVDELSDLAVLKVEAPGLRPAVVGDSDGLKVGQAVLAIGNQFGRLQGSVTMGIVSALGRSDFDDDPTLPVYRNFIQTDAAINNGNSGGPLVNLKGEVIGINTAISSPSGVNAGIGFAIPSNMIRFVVPQLISRGTVTRAWLGVNIEDVRRIRADVRQTYRIRGERGVIVTSVFEGSPAQEAGILPGDMVLEVEGEMISDRPKLQLVIAQRKPGSTLNLLIKRRGREREVAVRLEERPEDVSERRVQKLEMR
jgi:serine protease Do